MDELMACISGWLAKLLEVCRTKKQKRQDEVVGALPLLRGASPKSLGEGKV
jgi:hypothetical protein